MNDFERRIRQWIDPFRTRFMQWWSNSGRQNLSRRSKDLRDSDTAKRAASAVKDFRDSDTGKRAASALSDLRQREPVRKAEESAKRALHDLRSGHGNGGSAS